MTSSIGPLNLVMSTSNSTNIFTFFPLTLIQLRLFFLTLEVEHIFSYLSFPSKDFLSWIPSKYCR